MCAISAQAGATDVGLEAGALLRWNEGLEDRIITKKSMKVDEPAFPTVPTTFPIAGVPLPTAAVQPTPEQQRDVQQTDRRNTIKDALAQVYNSGQYDSEAIAVARAQFGPYSTNYVQFYAEDKVNVGNAGPAGIIPFQVGIEMDGISGIKIGQAFKINEGIMPAKYDGVVGFIVTGIDHNIAGNRWVTNLKAQTIVLKGTTEKLSVPTYSDGFTGTGVSTTEVAGLTPITNFKAENGPAKVAAEQYLGRNLSDTEWNQLVRATFAEAGVNQTERAYVMATILNRTRVAKSTVTSILTAKNQFQSVTGTASNGRQPSSNYRNGPDKVNEKNIYGAATGILKNVPKTIINFTAANRAAYGAGTNIAYLDTLKKKGGIQIGQTVFSS
jgi:hypothetical protein